MCLSNLDHRIRMLKRLWGFIESTPKLMGRPPTKSPDTWGLTLFLKTSTKSLQKVFKHQLSCQQSPWLVEFALAPPPLINPTPANRTSPLSLNIPTSAGAYVHCVAQLWPLSWQSCSNLCGGQGTGVGLRQPGPPHSPTWPLAALSFWGEANS